MPTDGEAWGARDQHRVERRVTGYGYSAAYLPAKHAMVGNDRALAIDLARTNVTINAVCPCWVETNMAEEAVSRIASKTAAPRRSALVVASMSRSAA